MKYIQFTLTLLFTFILASCSGSPFTSNVEETNTSPQTTSSDQIEERKKVRVTFKHGSLEIYTDKYKITGKNRFEIRSKEDERVFGLVIKEERKFPNDKRLQQKYAHGANAYGKADQVKINDEPPFYNNIYRIEELNHPIFKSDRTFAYYIADKELVDTSDHLKMKRYIVYQVIGTAWYKFMLSVPPEVDETKYLNDYLDMFHTFKP